MNKYDYYTDGGCIRPNGPSGWGVYVYTKHTGVLSELSLFGSILKSTNNRAEITAALRAVQHATTYSVPNFTLYTDSKYVLNGATKWCVNWKKKGWLRDDGSEVPNKDLWVELLTAIKTYRGTISWKWVKGHSGNEGNDKADELATRGNTLAKAGKVVSITAVPIEDVKAADAAPAKKKSKAKYSRLLSNNRLYFASHSPLPINPDGSTVYYTGTHGDDESYVGRRSADCVHSVVFLKEPDIAIANLVKNHQEGNRNSRPTLTIARLDTLLSSTNYTSICEPEDYTLIYDEARHSVAHVDGGVLSYDHRPPIQGLVHLNDLASLSDTLQAYLDKKPGIKATNITDSLYDTEIKGKGKKERVVYKLKPEIGATVKSLEVQFELPDGRMDSSMLSVGHILPSRNTMTGVASKSPVVNVIAWPDGSRAYRLAVVIETEEGAGLWTAFHANIKFTL